MKTKDKVRTSARFHRKFPESASVDFNQIGDVKIEAILCFRTIAGVIKLKRFRWSAHAPMKDSSHACHLSWATHGVGIASET